MAAGLPRRVTTISSPAAASPRMREKAWFASRAETERKLDALPGGATREMDGGRARPQVRGRASSESWSGERPTTAGRSSPRTVTSTRVPGSASPARR